MANDKDKNETPAVSNDANEDAPMFSHIDDATLKRLNTAVGRTIGRSSDLTVNEVGGVRSVFDAYTSFFVCRRCGSQTKSDTVPCETCGAMHEVTLYIGKPKG